MHSVNASRSDVGTVPLFFSPPSTKSYNPQHPPPWYIIFEHQDGHHLRKDAQYVDNLTEKNWTVNSL